MILMLAGMGLKSRVFTGYELNSQSVFSFSYSIAENIAVFLSSFSAVLFPMLVVFLSGFTVFSKSCAMIYSFVLGFSSYYVFDAVISVGFIPDIVRIVCGIYICALCASSDMEEVFFFSEGNLLRNSRTKVYITRFLYSISIVFHMFIIKELILLFI